jgi:hypothetical protein
MIKYFMKEKYFVVCALCGVSTGVSSGTGRE